MRYESVYSSDSMDWQAVPTFSEPGLMDLY